MKIQWRSLGRQCARGLLMLISVATAGDALSDTVRGELNEMNVPVQASPATPEQTAAKLVGAAAAAAGAAALGFAGAAALRPASHEFNHPLILRPALPRHIDVTLYHIGVALDSERDLMQRWLRTHWRDHPELVFDKLSCSFAYGNRDAYPEDVIEARAAIKVSAREGLSEHVPVDRWKEWIKEAIIDALQDLLEDKIEHIVRIKLEKGDTMTTAGAVRLALREQIREMRASTLRG